jgi:thiamine-phosphate pyrophosphorylase
MIPRLLVLTDRHQAEAAGRDLVTTVAAAVAAGAPAVLLREKDLSRPERAALADELAGITAAGGASLLVASDAELARAVGARGVHLAAGEDAVTDGLLVGRSCHDQREVRAAVAAGSDYVTVSPVAVTPSKPGYGPPLGSCDLAVLAGTAAGVPVLGLGGVTAEVVPDLLRGGAHGVAVMGAVMRAADPAAVVRHLLDRLAVAPW